MINNWVDLKIKHFKEKTKFNKIIVHDIKDIYSNPNIMELEEPYPYNLIVSNRAYHDTESRSYIKLFELICENERGEIKDKQYQIITPSRESDRSQYLNFVISTWNIDILKDLTERYYKIISEFSPIFYIISLIISFIHSESFTAFLLFSIITFIIYFPIMYLFVNEIASGIFSKVKFYNDINTVKKKFKNISKNKEFNYNSNSLYKNQIKLFKLIKNCNHIINNLSYLGDETVQNELKENLNSIINHLANIEECSNEKENIIEQLSKCTENLSELINIIDNMKSEKQLSFINQITNTIQEYNNIIKYLKSELMIQTDEILDNEVKLKIIEQDAKTLSDYLKIIKD